MGTLYIDFTEPSPAPSQYKVRYKKTTDSTWTDTTLASPPPFNISVVSSPSEYDVEVYSDCGSGVFSPADTDVAPYYECAEYTFTNAGATAETVDFHYCGTISTVTTISIPAGGTVGPYCITVGSSIGSPPFVFNGGPNVSETSTGLCNTIV